METIAAMNPLVTLFVFLATAGGDVLWALYIRRTEQGRSLSAAIFSALIVFMGGVVIAEYVENRWYLLPAALGAFVGTLITVHHDKKSHPTAQR